MTDEQKLEYQEIRDEYALLSQMISTTVNFSVLGSIAIFSFLGTISHAYFGLFVLPLLVIYPGCFIIISRIQSILRLAAYLIVFLEPGNDIKFETRLQNLNQKGKLKYSKTVLWVFLGLILINIGLFISKGYYCFWNIFSYIFSLAIYACIYYLLTRDWKKKFIILWEKVKLDENNSG